MFDFLYDENNFNRLSLSFYFALSSPEVRKSVSPEEFSNYRCLTSVFRSFGLSDFSIPFAMISQGLQAPL